MKTVYMRKVSLIILMILCVYHPASATDYYVKTGGSDGADGLSLETAFGSLGKAVTIAVDNDVIYVSGELQESVILSGKIFTFIGINNAVLKAPTNNRHFNITNGSNVRFENIEFTGASRPSGTGNSIEFSNSVGTLINCNFNNNSGNKGGAISVASSDLYIKGSIFSSNSTGNAYGGVIYAYENPGVVYSGHRTLHIENSVFTGNIAATTGGVFMIDNAVATHFTMINSTVNNNYCKTTNSGTVMQINAATVGSEFTFVNVTMKGNRPPEDLVINTAGINFWGSSNIGNLKFYNCVFEDNGLQRGDINFRANSTDASNPATVDIKGSIIKSGLSASGGNSNLTTLVTKDAVSVIAAALNTRNDWKQNEDKFSGLGAFSTTYKAYPLSSASSYAYNLGDATLLSASGYHTDQLKQYRTFSDEKCSAGAVEWIAGDAIVPTTSITATEIAGYSFGSLNTVNELTLTGTYTENDLKTLKGALSNNSAITKLDFEAFPAISNDYFTEINPNCLKFVPVETSTEIGWSNYIAEISAIRPIVLTDGYPFNCPTAITATHGVTYARDLSSVWQTIVLPFTVSASTNLSNVTVEAFSKINANDEAEFEATSTISANTAYIIKNSEDTSQPIVFTGDAGVSVQTLIDDASEFKGTYVEMTGNEANGVYTLSGNGTSFAKASAETIISPFRAYLDTTVSGESFNIKHGDEMPVGIQASEYDNTKIYAANGSIIINSAKLQPVEIYTIKGRNVYSAILGVGTIEISNLEKGVYIVNNQKIVVY